MGVLNKAVGVWRGEPLRKKRLVAKGTGKLLETSQNKTARDCFARCDDVDNCRAANSIPVNKVCNLYASGFTLAAHDNATAWIKLASRNETMDCAFNHVYDAGKRLADCKLYAESLNEMVDANTDGSWSTCGVTTTTVKTTTKKKTSGEYVGETPPREETSFVGAVVASFVLLLLCVAALWIKPWSSSGEGKDTNDLVTSYLYFLNPRQCSLTSLDSPPYEDAFYAESLMGSADVNQDRSMASFYCASTAKNGSSGGHVVYDYANAKDLFQNDNYDIASATFDYTQTDLVTSAEPKKTGDLIVYDNADGMNEGENGYDDYVAFHENGHKEQLYHDRHRRGTPGVSEEKGHDYRDGINGGVRRALYHVISDFTEQSMGEDAPRAFNVTNPDPPETACGHADEDKDDFDLACKTLSLTRSRVQDDSMNLYDNGEIDGGYLAVNIEADGTELSETDSETDGDQVEEYGPRPTIVSSIVAPGNYHQTSPWDYNGDSTDVYAEINTLQQEKDTASLRRQTLWEPKEMEWIVSDEHSTKEKDSCQCATAPEPHSCLYATAPEPLYDGDAFVENTVRTRKGPTQQSWRRMFRARTRSFDGTNSFSFEGTNL